MVQRPDKFSPPRFAGNGRVQRRIQDHLRLLKRRQLTKVAQELKEPDIPWQVGFAHATKHVKIRLEQGEQALGPVQVLGAPLPTRGIDGSRARGQVLPKRSGRRA